MTNQEVTLSFSSVKAAAETLAERNKSMPLCTVTTLAILRDGSVIVTGHPAGCFESLYLSEGEGMEYLIAGEVAEGLGAMIGLEV